jgi:hypothetical protein
VVLVVSGVVVVVVGLMSGGRVTDALVVEVVDDVGSPGSEGVGDEVGIPGTVVVVVVEVTGGTVVVAAGGGSVVAVVVAVVEDEVPGGTVVVVVEELLVVVVVDGAVVVAAAALVGTVGADVSAAAGLAGPATRTRDTTRGAIQLSDAAMR